MLPQTEPYLIGETAFHHQGDVNFLLELIEEAHALNLNALKFHLTIDLDDYMAADHQAIEVLRPWCLKAEQWEQVLPKVRECNIDLILLCNDLESLKWVNKSPLEVAAIELHATGLNDYFLLEEAARFKNTVILGTGGSTMDEIQYAIEFLKLKGKSDIFLMHGFQNYPTDFKDINLSKMNLLADIFNLPVGYADHTDPKDPDNASISVLAAGMGYNVLEKHFTTQFGKERVDSQAAVSIDQMKEIQRLLTKAIQTHGRGDLSMSDAEKQYGNTGPNKKAIVARHTLAKGHKITLADIAFKRTNQSATLKQLDLPRVLGLEATQTIEKDTFIDFSNLEYVFQKQDFSQFNKKES